MSEHLEFRGVSKRFGAIQAVDDVSLEIRKGEFFSLLGPSGCGKTTMLRIAAGFEQPDKGRVFLDGQDITDLPPNKRRVNTIFQSYALFPHMTVRDNIAFGLTIAKRPAAEIEARRRGHAQADPDGGPGRQEARSALGRPEAAGGRGPGPDQQARPSCCSTSRWPPSTSSSASGC